MTSGRCADPCGNFLNLSQHRRIDRTCPGGGICVLVPFVNAETPLPPAERLARIIDDVCKAAAARAPRGFLAIPVLLLLWARLKRMSLRITRLAARAAAGTLPTTPRASPRQPLARRPPATPPRRLPRRTGWLCQPVPAACAYASQLQHLLSEPDMLALLDAAPGIERLLRPFCRMLGVTRPKQPPRPTTPRPIAPSPTTPSLTARLPPPRHPPDPSAAPPAGAAPHSRPHPARRVVGASRPSQRLTLLRRSTIPWWRPDRVLCAAIPRPTRPSFRPDAGGAVSR